MLQFLPSAVKKPENSLADAQSALSKAQAKFEMAMTHALNDGVKRGEEVEALTKIITEKTARRIQLADLANVAEKVRDAIGLLSTNQQS